MVLRTIQEFIEEQEEIQRHMDALESLLRMRSKQLHESLQDRIKRAHTHGDWIELSPETCAGLHEQEKLNLKAQFDTFLHEVRRTKTKLASLKQAEKRARRLRTQEAASSKEKKRH